MQGTEAWQFMDGDRTVTVQPQGRFKADSATALAAAAAAGLGIAWLPDCITYDYVASGALDPVMTRYPVPPGAVYVVRPPGQHSTRKVRVLTEMLTDLILQPRPADQIGAGRRAVWPSEWTFLLCAAADNSTSLPHF